MDKIKIIDIKGEYFQQKKSKCGNNKINFIRH